MLELENTGCKAAIVVPCGLDLVILTVLTGFDWFFPPFALQEFHHHCLHRGAASQQPEPSALPAADVQPGSQRGHEDRRCSAKPAGTEPSLGLPDGAETFSTFLASVSMPCTSQSLHSGGKGAVERD